MYNYEQKEPEELMEILSERVMCAQIPAMVVTMGGKGAVYADCHGYKGWCPARKVQVKDTTGAGDAFCAGALVGIYRGLNEVDILNLATKAASISLTQPDAISGMRTEKEIDEVLKEIIS